MSFDNPYSGYSYKRKRFKRPGRILAWSIIALCVAAILLISNLIFGFIKPNRRPSDVLTLPAVSLWAEISSSCTTKKSALVNAREVRLEGGAGFLVANDNSWLVIESIHSVKPESTSTQEFVCQSVDLALAAAEHTDVLQTITATFQQNFSVLYEQTAQFQSDLTTAAEVTKIALDSYNSLRQLYAELDKVQENAQSPAYSTVMLYINKQLLTLYILSTEANSPNFLSALKHAACSVIFSYYYLTIELNSL